MIAATCRNGVAMPWLKPTENGVTRVTGTFFPTNRATWTRKSAGFRRPARLDGFGWYQPAIAGCRLEPAARTPLRTGGRLVSDVARRAADRHPTVLSHVRGRDHGLTPGSGRCEILMPAGNRRCPGHAPDVEDDVVGARELRVDPLDTEGVGSGGQDAALDLEAAAIASTGNFRQLEAQEERKSHELHLPGQGRWGSAGGDRTAVPIPEGGKTRIARRRIGEIDVE